MPTKQIINKDKICVFIVGKKITRF